MSHTSRTALLIDNVTYISKGRQELEHISLSVERGSFHGVLGVAGAGKTALAELVLGFRAPSRGRIEVLGSTPYPRRAKTLRRVGYQSQHPSFFPRMTLREHLRTVAGVYGSTDRRVNVIIEAFLLDEWVDVRVEELPVREQRLLSIATAVVHAPELLVLDEPTYMLNSQDRKHVVALLRSSNVVGMTTLYMTRHLDELERMCDTVTVLAGGVLVDSYGPGEELLTAPTRTHKTWVTQP